MNRNFPQHYRNQILSMKTRQERTETHAALVSDEATALADMLDGRKDAALIQKLMEVSQLLDARFKLVVIGCPVG